MGTWSLEPSSETMHGAFSREIPPVITIDPGDSVTFQTLDAGWNLGPRKSPYPDRANQLIPRKEEWLRGHALTGPVAVRGAEPGMTLAVSIDEIQVGEWGWTAAGGWPHPCHERLGFLEEETFLNWTLDRERMIGRDQFGHEVTLKPFMGVMGMPPAEPGSHPTPPPRATGGNLDCKELTVGTTLYLPIEVPGALFSTGDGHARQGDGELCVTAIECPMERVTLTFDLREDFPIRTPHARTPEAWVTLGVHEDLQEATYRAIEAMLDLMIREHGVSRGEAYALASVLVDLRVTQIVNGVRGVHAVLPHGALRRS